MIVTWNTRTCNLSCSVVKLNRLFCSEIDKIFPHCWNVICRIVPGSDCQGMNIFCIFDIIQLDFFVIKVGHILFISYISHALFFSVFVSFHSLFNFLHLSPFSHLNSISHNSQSQIYACHLKKGFWSVSNNLQHVKSLLANLDILDNRPAKQNLLWKLIKSKCPT